MTTKNPEIINWKNVFAHDRTFQEKNLLNGHLSRNSLQVISMKNCMKLIQKKMTAWFFETSNDKSAYRKWWTGRDPDGIPNDVEDPNFSEHWNKLHHYLFSDEFLSNIRKFSGVPVNKVKSLAFMLLTRGGYQLPHIHDVGPSTLILMLYFSKNWNKRRSWRNICDY